ncbi:MAG: polysaccharide biosynthesis C-terminal domain-containing protein, partial [Candidatus Syntrophosphaera sp.]
GFPLVTILIPALAVLQNIGLNFLLIPRWGINGAAISTNISYLLWFFLIIIYEQKQTGGEMLGYLIPVKSDWRNFRTIGGDLLQKTLGRLFKH